jgi:hypothetical protein
LDLLATINLEVVPFRAHAPFPALLPFLMHPGSRVLCGCSAPPAILPRIPQLCQNGGFKIYLQSGKQRKVGWVGDESHIVFGQKFSGEKESETVRYRDATGSSIVAKVRGEISAYFQAVATKRHSTMWKWLSGLPGRILCKQSLRCQRKL